METVWYVLVGLILTGYVLLDGFDLGAGIIHPFIARSEDERQMVIRSVGPVWDGNEVWLIAAGGTLFFAFPVLYASSFSGFYLSLHMVLWLLIGRAIGIEFREHLHVPIWHEFFDFVFFASSFLLVVFFGAAIGNVVRGVPLNAQHFFFEPLWTNWRVGVYNGILDWYTVLCALLVLAAIIVHGANYIALKTGREVQRRARWVAGFGLGPLFLFTVMALVASLRIRPELLQNYQHHPAGYAVPFLVLFSFVAMMYFSVKADDFARFLSSSAYIVFMLLGAAFALYPNLLPASTGPAYSLTIYNTAAGPYSLSGGLYWWSIGMAIAVGYFVLLYRFFRGKVTAESGAQT